MFGDQPSNPYYKKGLKATSIDKKAVPIEACQAIKRQGATSTRARKARKTSVDQASSKAMTSPRERLASTMKAGKSTLKTLVDEDASSNPALFFASRGSKLLERYAKKLEAIKTNLTMRWISFSKDESIRKETTPRLIDALATSR